MPQTVVKTAAHAPKKDNEKEKKNENTPCLKPRFTREDEEMFQEIKYERQVLAYDEDERE